MIVKGAGIDVAAEKFDVCILASGSPQYRTFPNNHRGFVACLKWFRSFAETIEFAFEPTGRYGELLVDFLYKNRCIGLQVQPFEFSRYAESLDCRVKSDKKDSFALAQYCLERSHKCKRWKPKTDSQLELRDLQLLLRSLVKRRVAIQSQLKCKLRSQFVREELEGELDLLDKREQQVLNRAEAIMLLDEQLSIDLAAIQEIPGIGLKTAVLLLTLIDFRAFKSARALACFLGITQRKHTSGTSIQGKESISKRGNTFIRSALFLPARSTRKLDPGSRALAQRLEAANKHDWVIQVAMMRRLVSVAWAVVTKGVRYQSDYQNPLSKPI